jgi:LuxR family transcriptional regulator, maltose regulon positive regulatory protein
MRYRLPVSQSPRPEKPTTTDLASNASFGPPRFEFETVPTRALSLALQGDPPPKLITVCAPPGYGKTVLLARLHGELQTQGQICYWVSLDDRDADLSSVVYKVRAALQPGAALTDMPPAESAFRDRSASDDSILLSLMHPPVATTLFMDNLGFCNDPALGPFLERLLFGSAPSLRLVLASTSEIPVDTVRAKLEVGARELKAAQLSFDRVSTAHLLQQAGIADTSEGDLDRILSHTEGWPAAVRLLQVLLASSPDGATSGSGSADIDHVLHRFSGDHSDIARVLTRRVLVGFDPDLVQFMIEIALVREFSPDLATHMTGRAEARDWLNQLVARNVLIFPLDHNRRWFRFHTLLREFLLAEAQDCVTTARRAEVLQRAARWHMGQGDDVAAIAIALEAGEHALAKELLDRIAHVVVGDHGQMATLIQWVDRLQAAGVMPSVEAHTWFVWALCDSLQYERAHRALDDFDRRMGVESGLPLGPGAEASRLMFARILVNLWVDRLDTAYEQAELWLARGDAPDALTQASVLGIAGDIEIDRGDLPAARARLAQANAVVARSDSAYGTAWVGILQACVEMGQARPDAADELLTSVHEQVSRVIGTEASVVVTMDFVHARALLDLGRLDAALELATRGLERAMNHGIIGSLEQGLIACVAFWNDASEDAVSTRLLERVAHSYPQRGQALLAASQVRRLIQLGRASDAQALAERHGLLPGTPRGPALPPMRERGDWMLARLELLLAQGACDEVLTQIDPLLKVARQQERVRDRIELMLLAADAHQRLGQTRMAVRHLSMSIVLATPGKLIQPFMVRQGLISNVLAEASVKEFGLTRASEWSFLDRIRPQDPAALQTAAATSRSGMANESPPATTGVPTLREIQLLTLLDQGLNNEQVADRLSLSVPTVKWHLHNVYVKLGVRGRSAALARARALHLLGP